MISQGAYQAVNHLIDKGRKNILLLTTQDYITVGRLRTQGYIKAIQDSDLVLNNELIIKVVDNTTPIQLYQLWKQRSKISF